MSGTTDSPEVSFQSFYVAGGTVPVGSAAYVTRRADDDLFKDLLRGEFCYILTSRQMGKSSLMARTAARLREEGLLAGVIDLTSIGHDLDREQWYYSLLMNLAGVLRIRQELRSFWKDREDLPHLQRWMEALRFVLTERPFERLVIFIDEIDTVLALPFEAGEFFAAIRSCLNRRSESPEFERLTFCLLGVANPSDLISDTRLTPFNIGRRIELNDFSEREARALEAGLGSEEIVRRAVLERVLHWTGGHPYLTQRLCQALVESEEVIAPELVDRLCDTLFLSSRAREQDDNLIFVRDRLLKHETVANSEEELAALLDLYRQVWLRKPVPDDKAVRLIGVLRLSGIVRSEEGFLRVRNRIYAQVFDGHWITEHMPDAEIRRQRAAYRRGVLRTVFVSSGLLTPAFIFAVIALVMSRQAVKEKNNAVKQTVRANSERDRANSERERAEGLLYVSDMNVVSQAFDNGEYGRVASILDAHVPTTGPDRRGFEWWYYWGLMHQDSRTLKPPGFNVVLGLAISCDGKTVATGDGAGKIVLWDADTYAQRGEIDTLQGGITQLTASPKDRRLLAACGDHGTVKLWDMNTLKEIDTAPSVLSVDRPLAHDAVAAAFSADGYRIAYNLQVAPNTKDHAIPQTQLWNRRTRQVLVSRIQRISPADAIGFTNEGRYVITIDEHDNLLLLDSSTLRIARTIHRSGRSGLTAFVLSRDGRRAVIGDGNGYIDVLDLQTYDLRNILAGNGYRVGYLALSPDGRRIAAAMWDQTIRLIDLDAPNKSHSLVGHTNRVTAVCFSSDGKRLFSTGDVSLKVWDLARLRDHPERRRVLQPGDTQSWFRPAFSPKGEIVQLFYTPDQRTLRLTADTGPAVRFRIKGLQDAQQADVSPDGNLIAISTGDSMVALYDTKSGQRLTQFTPDERQTGGVFLRFSPDGALLAFASGDPARATVWDVRRYKRIAWMQHSNGPEEIAFLPNSNVLAVANWQGVVFLWDYRRDPNPDPRKLERWRPHNGAVGSVAFSPDSKTLATSGEDHTLKLWNMATRREMVRLKIPTRGVSFLTFSPDGRTLMARVDKETWLWKIPPP